MIDSYVSLKWQFCLRRHFSVPKWQEVGEFGHFCHKMYMRKMGQVEVERSIKIMCLVSSQLKRGSRIPGGAIGLHTSLERGLVEKKCPGHNISQNRVSEDRKTSPAVFDKTTALKNGLNKNLISYSFGIVRPMTLHIA